MKNGRFHPPKLGKVQKAKEETLKGLSSNLLLLVPYLFGLMGSIHAGWFQHLPTLHKLLLEFSFLHSF
jgi:hypothetical protein